MVEIFTATYYYTFSGGNSQNYKQVNKLTLCWSILLSRSFLCASNSTN